MIPSFYLAATSALVQGGRCPGYAEACGHGHWYEALAMASRAADTVKDPSGLAVTMQACGDVSLLMDDAEEAEDWYRRSLRRLHQSAEMSAWSWRSAGLQALFRDRLESAATCFLRLSQHGNDRFLQMEALVFLVIISAQLGLMVPARRALAALVDCASDPQDAEWSALARTLEFDIATAIHLHTKPELNDHAYWASAQPASGAAHWPIPAPDTSPSHGRLGGLLAHRVLFIRRLSALADGDATVFPALQEALAWGGKQSGSYRVAAALEVMKACFAGQQSHLADIEVKTLSALGGAPGSATSGGNLHCRREYVYCMAKLRRMQGRLEESMTLYSRYAAGAMELLRREGAALTRVIAQEFPSPEAPKDDVSVRLPTRYRRAYEFMLRSIERSDLSIQEVAASIGVTERALQVTFKASLGEAPREVLRRLRLQRIREALISAADPQTSIMEVASRFGIVNRTSLLTGFRKYFREAPSDTVNRAISRSSEPERA